MSELPKIYVSSDHIDRTGSIDLLDRRGSIVYINGIGKALDQIESQRFAIELISLAEELFYLSGKDHASDACESLKNLLPNLLRSEPRE